MMKSTNCIFQAVPRGGTVQVIIHGIDNNPSDGGASHATYALVHNGAVLHVACRPVSGSLPNLALVTAAGDAFRFIRALRPDIHVRYFPVDKELAKHMEMPRRAFAAKCEADHGRIAAPMMH